MDAMSGTAFGVPICFATTAISRRLFPTRIHSLTHHLHNLYTSFHPIGHKFPHGIALTESSFVCMVAIQRISHRGFGRMDASKTSGRSFVEHWAYARQKGLMNQSTASAVETAVRRVLQVEGDWENIDITTIDVDDLIIRFNNLNAKDFKPRSLRDYGQRFRRALASYKNFLDDPSGWKYGSRSPTRRRTSPEDKDAYADNPQTFGETNLSGQTASSPALQTYMYPFRDGILARLEIPRDANTAEISRLVAWARTLAADYEPPE